MEAASAIHPLQYLLRDFIRRRLSHLFGSWWTFEVSRLQRTSRSINDTFTACDFHLPIINDKDNRFAGAEAKTLHDVSGDRNLPLLIYR